MGKDEEFLVTWTGNYEPTWVLGSVLKEDAPALVKEFLEVRLYYTVQISVKVNETCVRTAACSW